MTAWSVNKDGYWCGCCGNLVARIDSEIQPESCRQCGFPDPDAVAAYHGFDDDDSGDHDVEDDGWDDCGLMPDGSCSKAGSEECDWDCPHSG